MWKEFKKFAFRGNVIDLAVGVMIGGAFGSIVTSLVNDIFMPLITLLTGGVDIANWFISLDGQSYASLTAAKEANASVIAYGSFLAAVMNFLIIALCIFFFVKGINKLTSLKKHAKAVEEAPAPRLCPYCKVEIHADATRCPHCTSVLEEDK